MSWHAGVGENLEMVEMVEIRGALAEFRFMQQRLNYLRFLKVTCRRLAFARLGEPTISWRPSMGF